MSRDGDLRTIWNANLVGWHLQHIETGGTGRGIPDTNYCYECREGWIENKRGEGVKGDIIKIRPEQIGWIERRHRAGGRVFVAVRRQVLTAYSPDNWKRIDELWLLGPEHVRLRKLDPANCRMVQKGGPRNWDWSLIQAILTAG